MKIILTGATGYIGKRLLPVLLQGGHDVTCCVRNPDRFYTHPEYRDQISVMEVDFNKGYPDSEYEYDVAYYLIHSLKGTTKGYLDHEKKTAENFRSFAEKSRCKQVIYLGGIANEDNLSEHLASRKAVEEILMEGEFSTTILRAGIIVGSGSASFEIIRDLVEKLPIMVAPKWINTKCQPIAVKNVIEYLTAVIDDKRTYNQVFDIGGPDILSYRDMMFGFAEVRDLKRYIYTIPVMTPRLSSYWLYFITATNYTLAVNLVKSMKVNVVCNETRLQEMLNLDLISYKDSVRRAFGKIEQNMVISSWIDALSSSSDQPDISKYIKVPEHGCFRDERIFPIKNSYENVLHKIWTIGGENGWYYANFLWEFRGFLDKIAGGVGLRRGRKNQTDIHAGDALDFWRVLVADKTKGRLLLFAEMKLAGEAWLEFRISEREGVLKLIQTATFRPKGLSGRLYWYAVLPFHFIVFNGMAKSIARGN